MYVSLSVWINFVLSQRRPRVQRRCVIFNAGPRRLSVASAAGFPSASSFGTQLRAQQHPGSSSSLAHSLTHSRPLPLLSFPPYHLFFPCVLTTRALSSLSACAVCCWRCVSLQTDVSSALLPSIQMPCLPACLSACHWYLFSVPHALISMFLSVLAPQSWANMTHRCHMRTV